MADIMDTNPDNSPVSTVLLPVFHLNCMRLETPAGPRPLLGLVMTGSRRCYVSAAGGLRAPCLDLGQGGEGAGVVRLY